MKPTPQIRIVRVQYGPFPAAATLNVKMAPDRPLLYSTLEICWKAPDPTAAVSHLEQALLRFSSTFGKHECRGPRVYHVLLGGDGHHPVHPVAPPFEGALALAHIIEHAVIDFLCTVTDEKRCSGVTAALRDPPCRFDLMIECPDFHLGRCCLALAVAWLSSAAGGQDLGPEKQKTLAAARLAYSQPGRPLTPPVVARTLGCSERQAERALFELRDAGYLDEFSCTINLSGVPEFRVGAG
ncbi:MAG TPA: hypothetical protein VFT43_12500 [Candidatus Polarisedimenticolia bacterium]|nr:hypothetical protein [Candidatus Polarisedimenticolia bacterium]